VKLFTAATKCPMTALKLPSVVAVLPTTEMKLCILS
jgi:hypothetical protein